MVVLGRLVQLIAAKNEPGVAFVFALVSDAKPVSSRVEFSLASINEARL